MLVQLQFTEIRTENSISIYNKLIPVSSDHWNLLLDPVKENIIQYLTHELEKEEGIEVGTPILVFGQNFRGFRFLEVKKK
jgi:hypothetical protein